MTTPQPILDPQYWSKRLKQAQKTKVEHHAIFVCTRDKWEAVILKHRQILQEHIAHGDRVLDVGCGWGRLLELLPDQWDGVYTGVDVSPDFVQMARFKYPGRTFIAGDVRTMPAPVNRADWAVMISIRPMIRRNLGDDVWAEVEACVRKHAKKLLFLEYDIRDPGSVE